MKGRRTFIAGRETGWEPAIAIGLRWLVEALSGGATGVIVVPTMSQFSSGALVGAIGEPAAQALAAQRLVSFGKGRVVGATARTLSRSRGWSGGPALLLWPDRKLLATLNDDFRVGDLCVVPWTYGEVEPWAEGTHAVDLTRSRAPAPKQDLEALVQVALESLTNRVNLRTGLVHPSDKAAAVEMFKLLLRARSSWDPLSVETWGFQHGWSAEGARQLRDVAQGVQERHRYQTARGQWAPDIMKIWRSRVKDR
jgi:hypothetical protein